MPKEKNPTPADLRFARNLRRIIEQLDITQAEAAKMCDLTESHFSQILSGKRSGLRIQTIEKLAKGLGVPLDQLTQNPAHKAYRPGKDDPVHMTEKERKIWELYRALPRDDWKRKAIDEILITKSGKKGRTD